MQKATEIIHKLVNPQTLLFLSAGETSKSFYKRLAVEKKITPGAIVLTDEIFGGKENESNENRISQTGFISYCKEKMIPFYPIVHTTGSAEGLAKEYDTRLMFLIMQYAQKIAILDIEEDGRIAGIAPNRKDFTNPLFKQDDITLVSSYKDSKLGERITLTFPVLSLIDHFIVFGFGEEKKKIIQAMQQPGEETEIPARFLIRENMTTKTTLIID